MECPSKLICVAAKIPDEVSAMQYAAPANAVAGMLPAKSCWPTNVVNQVGY